MTLRHATLLALIATILLTALLARPAWPQASTAMLNGTVRDQTGGVIPTASVTLTGQDTNDTSKTTTNSVGYYVFALLFVDHPSRLVLGDDFLYLLMPVRIA